MLQTNSIDREDAVKLLRYEPETGKFFWRISTGPIKAGAQAGTINNRGYVRISINRREFLAHRIAWLISAGQMPSGEIDHINGDRTDNRISNLRLATHTQNSLNRGRNSNNTSGFKGVHRNGSKFRALICHNGTFFHLGMFSDPVEAHAAYVEASLRIHGEFGRAS